MSEIASQQEDMYHIPKRFRQMENLHIVFWLFKDVAWCMVWKPLGIVMIAPTLLISIVIAWRTRHIVAELCHNLAITIWISANSFWMLVLIPSHYLIAILISIWPLYHLVWAC